MNSKSIKLMLFSLIIAVIALSFVVVLFFKTYVNYRTINPPLTYAEKSNCTIEGLVFHWKLDSFDNGITKDESVNGITGVQQAFFNNKYISKLFYKPPVLVEGKVGKALNFNGESWISAGNKSCYNTDKFTISMWVWQDGDSDIYMPTLMAKSSWHGSSDGYDGWWLCTTPNEHYVDMGIAWGNGKTHISSGYQLPLNEWHHIAVTMDNQHHTAQFYIDGKPYGELQTHVQKWLNNWNHDLLIAGYDGSGRWSWPGKIDDVRFYSIVLTADAISTIYSEY